MELEIGSVQITKICTAQLTSAGLADYLSVLISEHHVLFKHCCPSVSQTPETNYNIMVHFPRLLKQWVFLFFTINTEVCEAIASLDSSTYITDSLKHVTPKRTRIYAISKVYIYIRAEMNSVVFEYSFFSILQYSNIAFQIFDYYSNKIINVFY